MPELRMFPSGRWICANLSNQVKMPEYSSKGVLEERLAVAISEGQGQFNLWPVVHTAELINCTGAFHLS